MAPVRQGRAEASSESTDGTSPPGANPASTSAMTSGVVVSSKEIPIRPSSTSRRLIPRARIRSWIAAAPPEAVALQSGTFTVSVSKKVSFSVSKPSRARPSRRRRAMRCTRRAMRESPSGPW